MKILVLILLIGLGAAGLILGLTQVGPSAGTALPAERIPLGHEEPRAGAIFVNGYNVADIGPCTFADTYRQAELLLGVPVSSFTGRTQTFVFGRLVCVPANPPGERVLWDDLGAAELRLAGLLPAPGSEPHPAVREHLLGALETGVDPGHVFGRMLSPVQCRKGQGCRQYTDKQLLLIDETAPVGQPVVSWAPLGLWHTHRSQPSVATTPPSRLTWLPPALGGVVVAAGLGVLLWRGRGRGFGPTI